MQPENRIEESHYGANHVQPIKTHLAQKGLPSLVKRPSEKSGVFGLTASIPKKIQHLTPNQTTKFKSFEEATYLYPPLKFSSEEKKSDCISKKAMSGTNLIGQFCLAKEVPKKSCFATAIPKIVISEPDTLKDRLEQSLSVSKR